MEVEKSFFFICCRRSTGVLMKVNHCCRCYLHLCFSCRDRSGHTAAPHALNAAYYSLQCILYAFILFSIYRRKLPKPHRGTDTCVNFWGVLRGRRLSRNDFVNTQLWMSCTVFLQDSNKVWVLQIYMRHIDLSDLYDGNFTILVEVW